MTPRLAQWTRGSDQALDELMPLVYEDLLAIARVILRGEVEKRRDTASLVHEVYLRLVGVKPKGFASRRDFYRLFAKLVRRVLVDEARSRRALKRRVEKPHGALAEAMPAPMPEQVLDLERALCELEKKHPEQVEMVELRYYLGLSVADTSAVLECSSRSVNRLWKRAQRFLRRRLGAPVELP